MSSGELCGRKRKRGGSRWKTNEVTKFKHASLTSPQTTTNQTDASCREDKITPNQSSDVVEKSAVDVEEESLFSSDPTYQITRAEFVAEWIKWPRQGKVLTGIPVLPIKCPLGASFDEFVPEVNRFNASMLVRCQRARGHDIGMILQIRHCSARSHLSSTSFWREIAGDDIKEELQNLDVNFVTLEIGKRSIIPTEDETQTFVKLVTLFMERNPGRVVVVHDVSSFNIIGFLLVALLVEHTNTSVDIALDTFSKSRPPGIYARSWLHTLYQRYDDATQEEALQFVSELHLQTPSWDKSAPASAPSNGVYAPVITESMSVNFTLPQLPQAKTVQADMAEKIRAKCKALYRGKKVFAGLEHGMITSEKLNIITKVSDHKQWMLTWRTQPVSQRLLVLFLKEGCFLLLPNRSHLLHELTVEQSHVLRVADIQLPQRKSPQTLVDKTLAEGELVVDRDAAADINTPRLLLTDVLVFNGHSIGKHPLSHRLQCARVELVEPLKKSCIARQIQPSMRMRVKTLFKLSQFSMLFDKVMRTLPHEFEGIVLLDSNAPHTSVSNVSAGDTLIDCNERDEVIREMFSSTFSAVQDT